MSLWFDLRYSIRTLLRKPTFALFAILSLALGIGANATIFNLIEALLIRDLPVSHPRELVSLTTLNSQQEQSGFSYPMFQEIDGSQTAFSNLFAWWDTGFNVEANGADSIAHVMTVSGGYFATLGVSPLVGRAITDEDVGTLDRPGSLVAVISYQYWQGHFAGASSPIGKIIRIEGIPFTIIGVTPKGFSGLTIDWPPEITVPASARITGNPFSRKFLGFQIVGRLKRGVQLGQARGQLEHLWPGIKEATIPDGLDSDGLRSFLAPRIKASSVAKGFSDLRERISESLFIMMGMALLVLAIACLNLATLMLARLVSRQNEMGLRIALGAKKGILIRQCMLEGLLVSVTGALIGIGAAYWASHIIVELTWVSLLPVDLNLRPDLRVLSFTAFIVLLTTVLFTLLPALYAISRAPMPLLRQKSSVWHSPGRMGMRKLLVLLQVALSLTFLMASGLCGRTLQNLRATNLGEQQDHILLVWLMANAGQNRQPHFDKAAYYRELIERLSKMPSVSSVSLSNLTPFIPVRWTEPARREPLAKASGIDAELRMVSPGFFRTFGTGFLQGRDFNFADDSHSRRVVIISKTLSDRLFSKGDAIGQRISIGDDAQQQDLEVVGVVNDASFYDLRSRRPAAAYFALFQRLSETSADLEIQTVNDPMAMVKTVQKEVEALGRDHVLQASVLRDQIERSLQRERMLAVVSRSFSVVCLVLAAVGLFGVISYGVETRLPELGVRVALGSTRRSVLWLVLRDGLALVLAGVILGIPTALLAARVLASSLFGVAAMNFTILVTSSLTLMLVGIASGFIPAVRGSRIEPVEALRRQ